MLTQSLLSTQLPKDDTWYESLMTSAEQDAINKLNIY